MLFEAGAVFLLVAGKYRSHSVIPFSRSDIAAAQQ